MLSAGNTLDGTSRCFLNATLRRPPTCHKRWPFDPCSGECHKGFVSYQFNHVMQTRSSLITYGQIYPILVTFTVVANIFVAIVLSRKHMRSPTNIVLLFMAIADLGVALVPFPFIFFYIFMENYRNLANLKEWWCYFAMYTAEAIPPICHNTAIWLTVLLAAQRYVYIQYPMKAVTVCSIKRVNICAFVILVTSIIVAMPKFVDFGYFKLMKWEKLDNLTGEVVDHEYQCMFTYSLLLKQVGLDIYYSVYYWVRVIFFVVLPSLLLIVFSALLVRGIRQAHKRRKRMFRDAQRGEAEKNKEKNTVNIMLVIIVLIFLVVNLPQGILLTLICFRQVLRFQVNQHSVLLVSNIDNMLILATYPINFAIYCGMSAQFRETFKELFSRNSPRAMFCFRGLRTRTARTLMTKVDTADNVDVPLVTPVKLRSETTRNGEVVDVNDVNL